MVSDLIVSGKFAVCLLIELDNQTLYFSDTALHEATIDWKERIVDQSGNRRGFSLETGWIEQSSFAVTLDNSDGLITDLMRENDFSRKPVSVFLKRIENGSVVFSELRGSGFISLDETEIRNEVEVVLKIDPYIFSHFRTFLQDIMTGGLFPDAAEEHIGLSFPIVLGNASRTNGCVKCLILDHAGHSGTAQQLLCNQGGLFDVPNVFRKRDSGFTTLNPSTHYDIITFEEHETGCFHGHVILKAAAGHQDGDEYFANVKGMPEEGFVTLDGSNDWLEIDAADTVGMPGHDFLGSFTVETKYRAATVPRTGGVIGVFDSTDRSWSVNQSNVLDIVTLSLGTDAGARNYLPDTTVTAGTDYIERWVVDFEAGIVRAWRDGVELSFTGSTNLPSGAIELNQSSEPFKIGSQHFIGNDVPFSGRIYYGIVAKGAQPLTTGSSDRDDPLENIISEHRLFYNGEDLTGNNDLTEVSLSSSDYTLVDYERNPAWILDRLLRWTWFWNIPSSAVNRATFAAMAEYFTSVGFDTDEYFSGAIPETFGESQESSDILQKFLLCCGAALSSDSDGKLILINSDFSVLPVEGDSIVTVSHQLGDLVESTVTIAYEPIKAANIQYKGSHHEKNYAAMLQGFNKTVKGKEVNINLPYVGHLEQAKNIIDIQMLNQSGKFVLVDLSVAGYQGLLNEVGNFVDLNLPLIKYEDKSFRVFGVSDNLLSGSPDIHLISLGDQVGIISYSFEDQVILNSVVDTYINFEAKSTSYGSSQIVKHQQHTSIVERAAYRFNLSEIPGGVTIRSANLKFYITNAYNFRDTGIPEASLRQLNSINWSGASTWNNFDGGVWTDANCGATPFASLVNLSGGGFKTFVWLTAGITYLQDRADNDGLVQLTFQPGSQMEPFYAELYETASSDHATSSWWPELIINFTV